ncbi:hypothetical protein Tco_0210684 [Tanacetum coccineum]
MFMANLTSEDPIYDEAGPSYDSNNPFEVQDHDAFIDHMDENHEVHEMQNGGTTQLRLLTLMLTLRVIEYYCGVQSRVSNKPDMVLNDTETSELARYNDRQACAEIEKKNLLNENENLIVNCLSTQLLYDVEKSRCLDLEADMSKVHDESKLISKLEREYLNLQLKYQHLQECFDNKNSQASQEAPDFNSFFKIKNLEHQIQEKDNVIDT